MNALRRMRPFVARVQQELKHMGWSDVLFGDHDKLCDSVAEGRTTEDYAVLILRKWLAKRRN